MKVPELSVIIPTYNEENNVIELWHRLLPILEQNTESFEVIFIDDGSEDATVDEISKLQKSDTRVGLIKLSRNFGHQIALMAGIEHARGKAIVAIDADLQHPPEVIPQLISKWRTGVHVIQAIRRYPESLAIFKRTTSRIFYKFMQKLSDIPIIPGAAEFFLIDRTVANALRQCKESSRFTRGLLSWVGFSRVSVSYDCQERYSGRTKYTLKKMIKLALDAVFSFSVKPLKLAGIIGLIATSFALLYLLYVIIISLFSTSTVPGWASLITLVTFLGGIQLITLWIIGEYLSRIAEETRGRPPYIIKEIKLPS